MLCVDNPPGHAVPDVGQFSKNDSEVPTAVRGQQSGNVLEQNGAGSNSVNDPDEVKEQSASGAGEAGAFPGDTDVLTGEPAADEVRTSGILFPLEPYNALITGRSTNDSLIVPSARNQRAGMNAIGKRSDVGDAFDAGPPGREDVSLPVVDFALQGAGPAGGVKAEVEPANAGE